VIFRSVSALQAFKKEFHKMKVQLTIRERPNYDIDSTTDRLYALVELKRSSNIVPIPSNDAIVNIDVPVNAEAIATLDPLLVDQYIDKHLASTNESPARVHLNIITYEPQDVNWSVMFRYRKTHTYLKRAIRWIVGNVALLVIVILFSTPYVAATFISNIAQASAYGIQNIQFFLNPSDPGVCFFIFEY
jgi:hypothetical protein